MSVQTNRKPNFLIILIDDMGVHQMGCYGNRFYETPNLDRLAEQSLVFDQAYATAPVCSPSRAGLYTGRHPARLHLTNYIPGTEPDNSPLATPPWTPFLPVEEPTVGDHFKTAGYETVHFGKWHLATDYNYQPGRPTDPESHGFDRVIYTRKPKPDADPDADPHHIDTLTDHARSYLGESHDKPFICFVAHNAIHRPEMAPKTLIDHFAAKEGSERDCNRPVLAAMVSRLDTSVGRLLETLDQSPEADNTIVIFTADHGAFGLTAERKPLRGAKADLYEGGIRIPLIVRMPGAARHTGRVETVTPNTDFLPTVAELAGIDLPDGAYDGRSIAPCLSGGDPGESGDLFWHFPHYHHQGVSPCGAMRSGRYKLVEWFEASIADSTDRPPFELYDLETDPYENVDLSAEKPELTREMADRLESWRQSVGAQPMTRNTDFNPDAEQVAAPPPPGDPASPYES